MNCALYARVSTTDQNCEMQLRELREYCARRGWTIVKEYVDTGWSGAKARRPQLDQLMKDAEMHHFCAVVVWKLDRWGRSVLHVSDSLRKLKGLEIAWLAITQGLDTSNGSPTANLLLNILAAVAEFEREMIRERVKSGMNAAKHRGKQLGRKKKVFNRQRALEMRNAGSSLREIAAALQVGRGTIERLLLVSQNGSDRTPAKSLN